jgi:hypothetical protein
MAALEALLRKIGLKISTRFVGRAALRAIPILGAIGNGAYSYYDTCEVGKTAAAYFKALADQSCQEDSENIVVDAEKTTKQKPQTREIRSKYANRPTSADTPP